MNKEEHPIALDETFEHKGNKGLLCLIFRRKKKDEKQLLKRI